MQNHFKPVISFVVSLLIAIPAVAAATPATTFDLKIGTYAKQYPIVPAPGNKSIGIAYLYDLNDNYALASQIAKELSSQIHKSGLLKQTDVLVMPGDSANMLGTLVYENLLKYKPDLKFCIIRASAKGGSYKTVEYQSITSTTKKVMHLREDQYNTIKNKNIIIFDDVLSTGATLNAVKNLATQADAKVLAYACFATEGTPIVDFNSRPLFKIAHCPIVNLNNNNKE